MAQGVPMDRATKEKGLNTEPAFFDGLGTSGTLLFCGGLDYFM
jgi:hypothetical protein